MPDLAALPPLQVAPRLEALRAAMARRGIEHAVITRLPNIRYLTGFTGSAALLALNARDALFVSDGRYGEQAQEQIGGAGAAVRIEIRTVASEQLDLLAQFHQGATAIALEEHGITWGQQRQWTGVFAGSELVPSGPLVEELRRVKDPGEVARIRAACAIADETFASLLPTLADGPSERELALALEIGMRERGASAVSFDAIVAAGPNAAKPHAVPSARRVERGEMVIFDFGCIVDGYCSDMTRTVSLGDPGPEARRVYDVVFEAQRQGRDSVRAGIDCAQLDAVCRGVIDDAGWGEAFSHGTGHGVGIEIHEAPRVARTARDTVLVPGDVVTVEPGVYLPGVGGVRIEDTVVVTETGCDPLTLTPKTLIL